MANEHRNRMSNLHEVSEAIGKLAEAKRKKQEELAPNGAPASDYVWDKQLMLSPNAIVLLKEALWKYYPEPSEVQLRRQLIQQLSDLQS